MTLSDRILMGPGPCNPYPEAVQALGRPMLGHLDPEFIALLDETNERLRTVFATSNALTFPVSATGSAGMEAAFVNFVGPGDTVVIGVNGVFGGRMVDVVSRTGAEAIAVDHEWGQPVDIDRMLAAHSSPAMYAMVHAETSTGVQSDIAAMGAHKGDALLLADCVTSLGGVDLRIDEWNVDIAYSGTQKCLGVAPGLAPLTVSDRAIERILPKPQSWYLDLNMIAAYVHRLGCTGVSPHRTDLDDHVVARRLGAVLDEGLDAVRVPPPDRRRRTQGRHAGPGLRACSPPRATAWRHSVRSRSRTDGSAPSRSRGPQSPARRVRHRDRRRTRPGRRQGAGGSARWGTRHVSATSPRCSLRSSDIID